MTEIYSYSHFVDLLLGMTEKELRARYKHTVFGFLWIVINPVLQMLVIGFIFQFFIKQTIEYYFHHLFIGLLVWQFFSLSLTKATPSIVYERSLIKKAPFPRSVIPLSIILSNLVHLSIAFAVFLLPLLMIGTFSPDKILHLLLGFFLLLVFTIGTSLITSALNVRFRDVNFFVQAALLVWFYATPIIYSLSMMPPKILWLWRFNPLTCILQLFQHAFLRDAAPGIAMLGSNIGVILLVFCLGAWIFRHESKNFDDWV